MSSALTRHGQNFPLGKNRGGKFMWPMVGQH